MLGRKNTTYDYVRVGMERGGLLTASSLQRTCSTAVSFWASDSRGSWKMTAGTLQATAITTELKLSVMSCIVFKYTVLCAGHSAGYFNLVSSISLNLFMP